MHQAEKTGFTRIQLVVYSLGGLAMNLTNLVVSQWLFERYVIGGVLSASIFSGILLAGRLTGGLSGPFVAFWTDNTRSRRGRRIPFLIYCVFPFAIVCFLLWTPPAEASATVRVVFSIAVTQLFFLGYALVVTPYLALLPEIAGPTDQRLNLTTGQAIAGMVGTLLFSLCGLIIQATGFIGLGWLMAFAVLISFYPLTFVIQEHHVPEKGARLWDVFGWIAQVARSRYFLPLLLSTSLYWFSLNLLLMLVPRWVEEVLHLQRDAVTWVMLPFIGVNLVGFFVFNWLGKRIGKFRGFLVVLGLSALMFPLLAVGPWLTFAPPLTVMQVLVAVSGLPVAGFAVLPFALLADVIDVDAKSSGARREAIYFGVQAIFQKSMIGFSVVAFATSHATFGARSLPWIAGAAGGICAMGLVIFCFYPLRKQL